MRPRVRSPSVSNLPLGSHDSRSRPSPATCSRQRPFGPGHQDRYPASYPHQPSGARPSAAVSCRLSAHRRSLLEHPVPARTSAPLTVGLPGIEPLDPDGVSTFRTSETRPGWVPSIPRGRRCSRDRLVFPGRRLPSPNGRALFPGRTPSTRGSGSRGVIEGSLVFTRPAFSLPVVTERIGDPWASTPSFAPRSYPQRTSRRRQASNTRPESRNRHRWPPTCAFTRNCATSCRSDHYQVRRYDA